MIIVITGPTGVGKTKLSIELAKHYNAEIINGDSVQVYKGLDIGSAKVTEEEKEGITHHLFDIKEVIEDYSIYDYQKDCREKITEITNRGKNVIIVGGTGLYIKSALYNYQLDEQVIENNYDGISTEEIYQRLLRVDPEIVIDRYNRKRVIRALDYYLATGKSIRTNNLGKELLYKAVFIGLTTEREKLYQRIDERVDKMIEQGLVKEVLGFYKQGIRSKILNSAIGYKELYKYFDGEITLDESISLIKQKSRHYAKRQYTFFRNQFNIKWIDVNFDDFYKTIEEAIEYIEKTTN